MTWQAMAEVTTDRPGASGDPASAEERVPAELVLPAVPSAPGRARRHLAAVLREWGLGSLTETAGLLASELVTNAVKISGKTRGLPGRGSAAAAVVRFTVSRAGSCLLLQVWDPVAQPPVRRESGPLADGGRGLFLVEMLSRCWGHYATTGGGKVVWCEVPLPRGSG